jgi:hypothetical protein
MLAVGVAFFALLKVYVEGNHRRDEACTLFERMHAADVKKVTDTVRFIAHPPPRLAGLVNLARAQLPVTFADAEASTEPGYCNEPGVGLPEPGPRVPPRPASLMPAVVRHPHG